MFCCMQCLVLRTDVLFISFYYFSQICEELDRPRQGEEEEKLEDIKENETDATERRKIRGEIGKSDFCSSPWHQHHDLNCK